jgi:hypothetical protein
MCFWWIAGSPYIKHFAGLDNKAKEYEQRLHLMVAVLHEWLNYQKGWMTLEPIFSSEGIASHLGKQVPKYVFRSFSFHATRT